MSDTQATGTGKVRITLVRSTIRRPADQKRAVSSLGLRKLHQSVVRTDGPAVRGVINKISHLVEVEDVADE